MTVRGSKNRILIYAGAALFLLAIVLFYHNAATRLDEARRAYDKCHLNEESLAAQLQVILEYKIRLEKSLQQEKSDHAQTKEDLKNKAQEERDSKNRENVELNNKYTALQQQYKLLQSQHDDLSQDLEKTKQQQLLVEDEKSRLENLTAGLTQQIKLLQDGRESDSLILKGKFTRLQSDYDKLKKTEGDATRLIKEKADLQRELSDCLRNHQSTAKRKSEEEAIAAPRRRSTSTTASHEPYAAAAAAAAGAAAIYKTSTPMINPDALQSQDRLSSPAPLAVGVGKIPSLSEFRGQQHPLPVPEPSSVVPKAHYEGRHSGVGKIPSLSEFREQQHPLPVPESQQRQQLHEPPPQQKEIPRNHVYNYQADYENEKDVHQEEDDDADDMDQVDFPNPNGKPVVPQVPPANLLIEDRHDSVMINPK